MKRLLLAAAAMAAVMTPTLSSAQSVDGGRGGGREGRGGWEGRRDGGGRGADRQTAAPAQAAPAPAPVQAAPAERQRGQGQWSGRGDGGRTAGRDRGPERSRGTEQARPDDRRSPDRNLDRSLSQGQRFESQRGDRGDQWRSDRGSDRRDLNRGDRYDSRSGFNNRDDRRRYQSSGSRWSRGDRDWWRGRSDFRGYNGVRAGFWFAPAYGYYRVDPSYYGRSWRVGDYVPGAYRRYIVQEPYVYGLDWPPPGFDWVYLGNDIVLMDPAGRIADILRGVF